MVPYILLICFALIIDPGVLITAGHYITQVQRLLHLNQRHYQLIQSGFLFVSLFVIYYGMIEKQADCIKAENEAVAATPAEAEYIKGTRSKSHLLIKLFNRSLWHIP